MRDIDRRGRVGRRRLLQGGIAAVPAAALASAGIGVSPHAAWAEAAQNLRPESMPVLVAVARDIYPHDRIPDHFYIEAVRAIDTKAGGAGPLRAIVEEGTLRLDADSHALFGVGYAEIPNEADRAAILAAIASTPFFKTMHAELTVAFYNQKELWPRFGYEGSSAEHGGYINRGFDDIDWLPRV